MYERNAFGLAGRVAGGLVRLVVLVLAVPVLSYVWWEVGGRGILAAIGGWVVVRVWASAARQARELQR